LNALCAIYRLFPRRTNHRFEVNRTGGLWVLVPICTMSLLNCIWVRITCAFRFSQSINQSIDQKTHLTAWFMNSALNFL
ncbi:hypothetical protein RvY_12092, partial [Ramazzottius varieornatus]